MPLDSWALDEEVGIEGQGGVDGVAAGVEGTEQDPECTVLRSA